MDTLELDRTLEIISQEISPEIQIQTIRTLLFIASRGSCNQKDLERELGFSNAAASRNVSYWSDLRADKKEGFGFIVRIEDKNDRRFRILTLSTQGRAFVERLRAYGKTKG